MGNCSVKVSCPYGDFHDEPEGTAPGRPGQSRAVRAHHQSRRRHGLACDRSAVSAPQAALRDWRRPGAAPLQPGTTLAASLAGDALRQIAELLTTTYTGFNDVHLTEKLREVHGLEVCRESVRRIRLGLGRPAKRPRQAPRHRRRREREAASGALIQVDGSPYAWLQARGPYLTLLGAIDDATGAIFFNDTPTTE